ncbi:MAG: hypothetical protein SGI73_11290 [Chloroflexota bacterium]|nr:hypothetical protein [Chloroflexota bacterium]
MLIPSRLMKLAKVRIGWRRDERDLVGDYGRGTRRRCAVSSGEYARRVVAFMDAALR